MAIQSFDSDVERLRQENIRLRRAVEELSLLNEIATAINSSMTLDRILNLMLQKCQKAMQLEQGAVLLLDQPEAENPFKTKVRRGDTDSDILPYRLDTQLTGWMIRHQQPLLVNNLAADPRFRGIEGEDVPIKTLLAVPLLVKGRMIGVLTMFNKREDGGFTDEDQRLLTIIAMQSAQVIENARLLEEEKALLRMQEELRLAAHIQNNLLPEKAPPFPGYDIAGRSVPAKQVGGDYFDFMLLDGHRLAFCLGDITGKGMPAALLMSNLQATVRGQAVLSESAGDCVKRANLMLYHSTTAEKFATFFYGILDRERHTLSYSNAGHNYPLLFRRNGALQHLKTGGIVLGCLEEYDFEEETLPFHAGDLLVVFSDGIPDAENRNEQEFGEEHLAEVIRRHRQETAAGLLERILMSVNEFAAGCPQRDDMTLLVIRCPE
ncbi:MAG: SpoIIE family protein phosphatase [Acidobacteria bacterium]|nr:SpoIIE family protein phosphatase [Acidobacteriota bacterium]